MNIRKLAGFVISTAFILSAAAVSALEVYQDELKTAGSSDTVVFINYTGPHARIDSLADIRQIGTGMGNVIAEDPASPSSAGTQARYYVIHAVDPDETGKLDADIMFIGSSAGVDHIDNLRHIIASYLMSAYGYSENDAETLAVFITVYNAVYRGRLDSYQNKYKNAVIRNLTESSCGLALNYREWPGNSQIVIPLFDVNNGGLSTVDTSVISDTEVVKHMQEDDDRNIDSRKDMVDIKEREAEQSAEKAQTAQKQAVEEQQKLETEQKKTEEIRNEAETAQKEAEEALKKAEENPEDEEAQQEAAEKQEAAEQKQEELAQQEQKTEEQAQKTEEAKQTAAEQQAVADKKTAEAQNERSNIAKDQQAVIEKEIADAAAPSAYGIKLTDDKNMLSSLVKINTSTGSVIKSSPVTYIRNRTVFRAGDNYIAIAGENSGNGAVKLVLLSPDTMEITAESNEIVAETSVLIQDGGEYYCIIQDGQSWVPAKYDQTLTLKLKSPVTVNRNTPVSITSAGIIVTSESGAVKLLNKADLKEISSTDMSNAK